jgi:hypothetical protein
MQVDGTIHAALRHRFHDHCAEPAPLRHRHGRPVALGPAYGEGVALGAPPDIRTASIRRGARYLLALVASSCSARPMP